MDDGRRLPREHRPRADAVNQVQRTDTHKVLLTGMKLAEVRCAHVRPRAQSDQIGTVLAGRACQGVTTQPAI